MDFADLGQQVAPDEGAYDEEEYVPCALPGVIGANVTVADSGERHGHDVYADGVSFQLAVCRAYVAPLYAVRTLPPHKLIEFSHVRVCVCVCVCVFVCIYI